MSLRPHSLAREVAYRREAQLIAAIVDYVAEACPFPVRVMWQPDHERLTVIAGRFPVVTLAALDSREVHDTTPEALAERLAVDARDAYLALEPLPHDHTLGQD